MQGNRARDTKPEMALRRALHARGHRYRVDVRPLPGLNRRADLLFSRQGVVVLVHGCYWHGCLRHYTEPKHNSDFWTSKVLANRARDADTVTRLTDAGWLVVVVWEHETVHAAVERVESALKGRTRGTAAL
jgi:DNA mismatch endonuclease (patch repair protein)